MAFSAPNAHLPLKALILALKWKFRNHFLLSGELSAKLSIWNALRAGWDQSE
jgi:hypothetical protein